MKALLKKLKPNQREKIREKHQLTTTPQPSWKSVHFSQLRISGKIPSVWRSLL